MGVRFDVCNGDADGLSSVIQWRLHEPLRAMLLTGLKREITLLERVPAMAGDEVNTTLVRSFRKEMDGIAKTALEFLEKYNDLEKMPEAHLSSFAAEFDQIGSVVHARMQREEETLYPLYAASY